MNYLQFDFETENEAQCEILMALLTDAGFEGFEEAGNHLKAFIKEAALNMEQLGEVLKTVPVQFKQTIIQPQNWNAKWESSFEPVMVNDFAVIRAGFHQPVKNVLHDIIITPKMSFGTGHHATTFLMIEQMSKLDIRDKNLLDFGTGTGVLAILAAKMGANKIKAIDNDDWSIENSKENIKANDCSKINIEKADSISVNEKYDAILANINLNVILANLPGIAASAKTGTIVLLSGFLTSDEQPILNAIAQHGFTRISTSSKGAWLCLNIQKN